MHRKKAPLRKLMNAYCERQGHPEKSVIFLYDGEWPTNTSRASSCD